VCTQWIRFLSLYNCLYLVIYTGLKEITIWWLDLCYAVLGEAEFPSNLGPAIFVAENLYEWCVYSLAIQSCVI